MQLFRIMLWLLRSYSSGNKITPHLIGICIFIILIFVGRTAVFFGFRGVSRLRIGKTRKRSMRAILLSTVVIVIAGTVGMDVSVAASRYDGTWSVSLMTKEGVCNVGASWNVAVANGRIGTDGMFVQFAGVVDPKGHVRLKASHGSSLLVASGTMRGTNGSGTWLSSSDRCSGQWRATRASL